jgi:rieske iron-sulfur protein
MASAAARLLRSYAIQVRPCAACVWVAEQKVFECSCHYSHYDPREGAAVIDGPAPRALAALPLKVADGKLVVAKPFTARVGIVPT